MSISKKLLQVASGNAVSDNLYVEDVFSTYLYDGNVAPTLTAKDTLVFWKVSTTLYGAYTGSCV